MGILLFCRGTHTSLPAAEEMPVLHLLYWLGLYLELEEEANRGNS